MKPPEQDLDDRFEIWQAMEIFWLDTDVNIFFDSSAERCAGSKYTVNELRAIFWNEAAPAFRINLMGIAGEWAGFDPEWIIKRVLKKHRFGKKINVISGIFGASSWWNKLENRVKEIRLTQVKDD